MSVKIASWNLCLGLKKKKDYVLNTLRQENIDICLLQEVDIPRDYPTNILSSKDYKLEVEKSTVKSRCAILIKNNIDYTRREDLESIDLSLCVIDVNGSENWRIINCYRLFNPPNNQSQSEHFALQLERINDILSNPNGRKIIIAGDFNLDEDNRYSTSYRYKNLFNIQNAIFDNHHLIQIVEFHTWQRVINNVIRKSILDHVYVKDPTHVFNLYSIEPLVGDHKLIIFEILHKNEPAKVILKRNWQQYTPISLLNELASTDFDIIADDVQSMWNRFENVLLPIIDKLAPMTEFTNNSTVKSQNPSAAIKNKIHLRKRLLKTLEKKPSNPLRDRIKNLNIEIRHHFRSLKTKSIRRKITPGNSKSLWDAVRLAKNVNIQQLPQKMFKDNINIKNEDLPDEFANFFKSKVDNIVNAQIIKNDVFNGTQKLTPTDLDFMQESDVETAINSLKNKNCEGHDRIPVRILADGKLLLLKPLTQLFRKIYQTRQIPEQWLISKIIPIHKKGQTKIVENYRPIANLCSCSKIFEKLILQRIRKLEFDNKIDLTGKSQHGFKPKHSTLTAGLKLQTLITRAVDEDMYALMASLDLSAAFDVVNVELLLKRLNIIGLPSDVIDLVSVWLTNRYFYVSLDGSNSCVHECNVGTVQGSILGPILYSIFVSPLLALTELTLFADDNYALVWNKSKADIVLAMQTKLELITSWLRDSGLKVNENKTEVCLFHRKDQPLITLTLNGNILKSKDNMNVLGVAFDCKLNWQIQVQKVITKAKSNLHAIQLIRNHFTKKETLQLITSNYYSVLYYNSEIWHLPSLSNITKKQLLSASAQPLKMCTHNYDQSISFITLHTLNNRATPDKMIKYKTSLLLHKIVNNNDMSLEWQQLFFNQNFNQRNNRANFRDLSKYRIGKNLITNRLNILNNKIPYDWFNESIQSFKIKCKALFL